MHMCFFLFSLFLVRMHMHLHRIKQPALKLHGNKESLCKPCHMTQLASVCGSDGHTYSSVCKLEQQACLTSKQLTVKCEGPCPCASEHSPTSVTDGKQGSAPIDLQSTECSYYNFSHLVYVEKTQRHFFFLTHLFCFVFVWHHLFAVLDKSLVASCKDSIGWMFSKLDTNSDLFLDQTELAAINLDKYEICIRPFFNSCDTYKDGRVSTAEWCFCFWRESASTQGFLLKASWSFVLAAFSQLGIVIPYGVLIIVGDTQRHAHAVNASMDGVFALDVTEPPCLVELERIQIQEAAKKKPGAFIPSCDEDGYYRKMQCDSSSGECWCVDHLGTELTGTRMHGNPDCDDIVGFSGDFGSGVGWEDEEEKETEEAGEEAEEEEGEAGEADDGGYICSMPDSSNDDDDDDDNDDDDDE
ncbi:hypothetical protein JD844_006433 [Phrynosoma platyrhinos]|uniref:SPARC (osteonectin), cwcv and kazal like domains proteoglycan 2 n=1 Tax=Phrynosoma platyrhinos TaxID=52577 RepID=A0ABQ7T1N8_PHRPL|nr:hypothetical protein JD844_006433 [Phrynosoma platyrhinos]